MFLFLQVQVRKFYKVDIAFETYKKVAWNQLLVKNENCMENVVKLSRNHTNICQVKGITF